MQFLLIDLNNLVKRAQHGKGMGGAGEDFAGLILHTSLDTISFYHNHFGGGHLVICVDQGSWRYGVYPEYKGHREYDENDALVKTLINDLAEFFRSKSNCTVLQAPKVEADDFIARWTQLHADPEHDNLIISGDYDFKQLVNDNTSLYAPQPKHLFTNVGVFSQEKKPNPSRDVIASRYGTDWAVVMGKEGEYLTFDPEYELFVKCIRGDSSDHIMSAFPRVRETRMKKAWADRGGLEWNNFINDTWGPDGENSVREKYEFNKALIDLTRIPEPVIDQIDTVIGQELLKPKRTMIPMQFSKYCGQHDLRTLMQRATSFTPLLSTRYPLESVQQ